MIKHVCDFCKGDYIIVESNHYRYKDDYRLVVVQDGEQKEVCKACIGTVFFNLPLINVDGQDIPYRVVI